MLRTTAVLVAMIFPAPSLSADDLYRIRVAFVGYENRLDFEIEQDDEELYVMETIVQPGVPFLAQLHTGRVESKTGRMTLTMRGQLTQDDEGQFILDLKTSRVIDTGCRVPVSDSKMEAVLDENSARTRVAPSLDKPLLLGGTEDRSESRRRIWLTKSGEESAGPAPGGTRAEVVESRLFKLHRVVVVTKYQPEVE